MEPWGSLQHILLQRCVCRWVNRCIGRSKETDLRDQDLDLRVGFGITVGNNFVLSGRKLDPAAQSW